MTRSPFYGTFLLDPRAKARETRDQWAPLSTTGATRLPSGGGVSKVSVVLFSGILENMHEVPVQAVRMLSHQHIGPKQPE